MTASETEPVASTIADFVAGVRPGELPVNVVHEAKRSLLNFIGCAVGIGRNPVMADIIAVLEPFSGPGTATLMGRSERLDPLTAAFVNAVAGNTLAFDDTHLATVIHPTAPVAPAALAMAETRGLSGAQVLTAFALGAEFECRIGNAVMPEHYARGWHITATCGVFGSAVATSHLLGLTRQQIANALGIAASSAAGVVENLPTGAKNVGVGNAARGGIVAALFAEKGFDGAPRAIEGPLGWAKAAGHAAKIDEIVGGLGTRWELLANTYKAYACGIVMHSIIDACIELKQSHAIDPAAVVSVIIAGDALLMARGDRVVNNVRDARISNAHCAACGFLWGSAGIADFAQGKVMAPEAVAFRSKVRCERDDRLPVGAARVSVRMADGREYQTTVLHPQGSLEKPLPDAAIEVKVRDLVALAGTGLDASRISDGVWTLDRAAGIAPLLAATVPRLT